MSEIIIKWKASEILRKQELVKDGASGEISRSIQIYAETLTPEARAAAVEVGAFNSSTGNVCIDLTEKYSSPPDSVEKSFYHSTKSMYLDKEPDLADAIRIRKELMEAHRVAKEFYEKQKAWKEERDKAETADREARQAKAEEEAERKKAARQAKKEPYEKERAEWIEKHGSQYLKNLLEIDVDPERGYVIERAEAECHGFVVDYEDHARWDATICDMPSTEIVSKVKEYRAKGFNEIFPAILENYPVATEKDHPDSFESCQAVIIRGFLGKYDLVWTE
jgi:flagellar biosynthesis GTPase FlhF